LLNVLPSEITGLSHPVLPPNSDLTSAKFVKQYGYGFSDIENFYRFVLVQEQMSRIDRVIKKAASWIIIATEGPTYDPEDPLIRGFFGGKSLSFAIQERLKKQDTYKFTHPVQDAARSLALKLVDILNMLSSGDESAFSVLASDRIFSLTTALDKKAQYTES
jgi:hypothetical protein